MQIKHGIQHVRTHVDVGDPELKGMKALLEVKRRNETLGRSSARCYATRGTLYETKC